MLKALLERKAGIESAMAALQEEINALNVEINHLLATRLNDLRSLQGKEFGAVNMNFEGFKITETIPKKVEWDQEKLNDIFDRIATAGDDPRNYIKMKLEVGEKQYEQFNDNIKIVFAEARTVKPGKATLKFEEVDNA